MRVAMVTHFPENLSKPVGGVATASIALLRGLSRYGDLDLHVVTSHVSRRFRLEEPRCTVHPFPVNRWLPGFLAGVTTARWRVAKVLKAIQPDLVHLQNDAYLVDGRRWPSILTVHGIIELDLLYSHRAFRGFRSRLAAATEAKGRSCFRHIISISDYVLRQLAGQLRGECTFIPNAVEDVFFDLVRSPVPRRVLFVGSIIQRKNVAGLLEAARLIRDAVPDFSLHFAGQPYAAEYLELQRRRCKELGLSKHVRFLGNLGREELHRELAAAACLVLPSFQETLPVAIAEAMAVGIPIVASAVAGIPEMVADGENGFLIDPHRTDQIADRLIRILQDPVLAERLGRASKEKAQAYRIARVAAQTREVYLKVLAEKGRAGARHAE